MSATYDLIKATMKDRQSITGMFDNYQRDLTPHVIGWNKNGGEQCLFFQYGGGSSSGLPPEGMWKCLPLARLSDVATQSGWHVGTSQGSRRQSCVVTIDATSGD